MQQTGQDTVLPGVAWLLRFVACPGMWSARRVLRPVYNADADVYGGTGARAAPAVLVVLTLAALAAVYLRAGRDGARATAA